jgi:hypothetical protein
MRPRTAADPGIRSNNRAFRRTLFRLSSYTLESERVCTVVTLSRACWNPPPRSDPPGDSSPASIVRRIPVLISQPNINPERFRESRERNSPASLAVVCNFRGSWRAREQP